VPILKIGDQKHKRCRELPCREIAAFCGYRPGRLRSLPGPTAATASGTKRRTYGLEVASAYVRPRSVRIMNVLRRPSEHTAVRTSGRPRVYAREQRPRSNNPRTWCCDRHQAAFSPDARSVLTTARPGTQPTHSSCFLRYGRSGAWRRSLDETSITACAVQPQALPAKGGSRDARNGAETGFDHKRVD
jgi:hypothetical protein